MQLHDVHQGIKRRKKRKRIGRGVGSGHGKTSTNAFSLLAPMNTLMDVVQLH
jgi:hypothetical protein